MTTCAGGFCLDGKVQHEIELILNIHRAYIHRELALYSDW
jgi:hypothetical protein